MKLLKRRPPVLTRLRPGKQRAVFSYYQNRESLRPKGVAATPKPSVRSRLAFLVHLPMYITMVVLAGCVLYSLTLSSNPRILIVNGQTRDIHTLLRSTEVYRVFAQSKLERSPFNYLKLTVNDKAIARDLQEEFPEISEASMTIPLAGRRPVIYITIAQPTIILASQNNSFILDEQGRAVIKTSDVPNVAQLHLLTIQDNANIPIKLTQQALPTDQIAFIQTVVGQLSAKGLSLQVGSLPDRASELDVRLRNLPYSIKFNLLNDPREQVGTFLALKQKLDHDHIRPGKYIDVRVPGRAYYR